MMTKARALRAAWPCAIVIFGAAGDLTKRTLFRALSSLKAIGRELAIVGVASPPAASMGPAAAEQLVARDGRGWWWP